MAKKESKQSQGSSGPVAPPELKVSEPKAPLRVVVRPMSRGTAAQIADALNVALYALNYVQFPTYYGITQDRRARAIKEVTRLERLSRGAVNRSVEE